MNPAGFIDDGAGDGGIDGVAVGIVTDNEDPKDLGRVKLRFPWRDADDESHWARIATEMAGAEYGTYFLPEIDDEVLVAFENGDIHKPFVIGSLWNGKQKPPRKNGDGNNDVREVRSRSDHVIAFDDADDGSITIRTTGGNEIVIDDSGSSETIRIRDDSNDNSITLDSTGGTVAIDAKSEIELSASTISLDGNSVKIAGKKGVTLKGKGPVTVDSKAKLSLSGSMVTVDGTGMVKVKGSLITLN
ncbi:phage baseplate assembly protein V [Natrinema ejinorense]|uniref:Phage tail protein n=1 Tax=Natrinema ejinorense TaxID=373386 RepID=A0A2A5QZJ2_9EURY|nr:phage baseplate assembly protein V [Natrinema ejinorense]PCR92241.1 phage tail protein [Natrinema ejinorense]